MYVAEGECRVEEVGPVYVMNVFHMYVYILRKNERLQELMQSISPISIVFVEKYQRCNRFSLFFVDLYIFNNIHHNLKKMMQE